MVLLFVILQSSFGRKYPNRTPSFLFSIPLATLSSLGGGDYPDLGVSDANLSTAMKSFPIQVSGYLMRGTHLYYDVVLTPVYVQSGMGQALLNMLLVALDIDDQLVF